MKQLIVLGITVLVSALSSQAAVPASSPRPATVAAGEELVCDSWNSTHLPAPDTLEVFSSSANVDDVGTTDAVASSAVNIFAWINCMLEAWQGGWDPEEGTCASPKGCRCLALFGKGPL